MRGVWAAGLVCATLLAAAAAAERSDDDSVIASLRSAGAARAAGDAPAAARGFAAVAETAPGVAAHARRLEAAAWLEAGEAEQAVKAARAGLALGPHAALAVELLDLEARARLAEGDAAAARAAWQEALAREPARERAAGIRLALGAALAEAGESAAAADVLVRVWRDAADRPEAAAAGTRLEALEAARERPLRSADDFRRRGDRLFDAQRSADSLAAYDAALAAGLGGAEARRVRWRRAHALFRLRRYAESEEAFAALGGGAEARVWRARSMARQGRVEEAIEALEAIGAERHGEMSAWARFLAGLLHAGRGRSERAAALFTSVADGADASPGVAGDADWQLGWTAYTTGDREAARRRFLARAPRQQDPIEAIAARYWAARALEPSAPAEAAAELAEIAREAPFSYYGWRAARDPSAPPAPGPPIAEGRVRLDPEGLRAARLLAAAGLDEATRLELGALEPRAGGVRDRIALGHLYTRAGDWAGAQGLVERAYGERLARGPAPGQEELWRLAWPRAFPDALAAALPESGIAPELVLSILREESRYRPDAVSVTGARGLVQLMPETAARLARELGLPPPEPDALFDPALNLRLGAHYLGALARRFDGRLPPAIASYNAGPEVVGEWLRERGAWPDDEWIESIPYAETRKYAKRVLRSLHVYRTLGP